MGIIKIFKKIYSIIDFKKLKNINWGVVFFVNLLISIFIFIKLMNKANKFKSQTETVLIKLENHSHIPKKYLHFTIDDYDNIILHIKTFFFVTILSVIISNILHLFLACIFPKAYVNISSYAYIFLTLTISASINFLLFYTNQQIENKKLKYLLIIIGIIFAIIGIFLIFFIKKYNKTSILLIKASSSLVSKYPSLLFLAFIQSILLFIMNALFTIIITLSFTPIWPIRHIVSLILYLTFSYYWIASTLYYVCYMTISGVITYEFQDSYQTNWAPFFSFWRVITSQFNNAVFAGLALTMIKFNQHKARKRKPKLHYLVKNRNIFIRIIVYIFEIPGFIMSYILSFVFSIIESILTDISSNALIYCMIYNCSYKEGTEKWIKENIEDRINKINQNTMIKNIIFCHRINFTVFALLLSNFSLYHFGEKLQIVDYFITIVMTIMLMHSAFSIWCTLIKTTSETLFLSFVETPQKMNKKFNDLYLQLNQF